MTNNIASWDNWERKHGLTPQEEALLTETGTIVFGNVSNQYYTKSPADKPTVLYRLWDKDDNLLYIGISYNPIKRLDGHCVDKPWFSEITAITLEHLPTRTDASEKEIKAIKKENPKYNLAHKDT